MSSRNGWILIVEDEPVLAGALAELLADEGYEVELARDGAEAETAMRARAFRLVFLDCALPAPSGPDLLARWRAAGHTVPVVLMSGDLELGKDAAGAQAFLAKPFAFTDFLAMVDKLAAPDFS